MKWIVGVVAVAGLVVGTAVAFGHHRGVLDVPSEVPELQLAVQYVQDGGTIVLAEGVFSAPTMTTLDGRTTGPWLFHRVEVTIRGAGPGKTIIDVGDHELGFLLSGTSTDVIFEDLTIRGSGAALITLLDQSTALVLENVILEGGSATTALVSSVNGGVEVRKSTLVGTGTQAALAAPARANFFDSTVFSNLATHATSPADAVTYCAFHQVAAGVPVGTGNIAVADPGFVGGGDYHLLSAAGRPTPAGYVLDSITSPLQDAGDPLASVLDEPWPHGARLDIGAYAGTAEASLSTERCAGMTCGDCDGDGQTNILDALSVGQVAAGIVPPPAFSSARFASCNPYGLQTPEAGAALDILDALAIAQNAAGVAALVCC